MKTRSRLVVSAILGCVVGSLVTAQFVRGQAGTPLEGSLSHISFVVNDVDQTMKAFGKVFGVEGKPAQTYRDVPWGPDFPGKVMHGKIGQLRINNIGFEFIQPLEGESPWKDHLTKKGEGVHHIGFSVADVPAAVAVLRSKGGKQTQGYSPTVIYMDMNGAGLPITFEITGGYKGQGPKP
jgi:hypothetical protein